MIKSKSAKDSWPWLTFVLVALVCSLHFLLAQDLVGHKALWWLDREQTAQIWRAVTAHWIHADNEHLLWNAAALFLLGGFTELYSRSMLVTALVLGTVGVSIWFFFFAETPLYCGLSGVLNALLVTSLLLAANSAWQQQDRLVLTVIGLVTLGSIAKLVSESVLQYQWVTVGVWAAAPGAHVAGFVAGLLLIPYAKLTKGFNTMYT